MVKKMKRKRLKKQMKKKSIKFFLLFGIIISLVFIMGLYHIYKPLPKGLSFEGQIFNVSEENIEFLYDLTYENKDGEIVHQQEIFDKIFETIDNAERFVLIDMFYWKEGKEESSRNLGEELVRHLVERKKKFPDIKIVVITDPLNTCYNSFELSFFQELKNNNIPLIFTNLDKLRDGKVIYSPIWRTFFWIWGEPGRGWIQTPLFTEKISIKSFLKLLNFKSNHRKVAIIDCKNKICSFVISANPSGGDVDNSNVGILVKEELYKDLYETEKSILKMSNFELEDWDFDFVEKDENEKDIQVQLLTEGKIKENLIRELNQVEKGDKIKIAMFFLSDRDIIESLLEASEIGVDIELVVDPNKHSFGRPNYGIPSRIVIEELIKKSNGKIKARFYNTHNEQFHSKIIIIVKKDKIIIFIGSSNLTRKALKDFHLETNVKITSGKEKEFAKEILEYFELIYTNKGGDKYTLDTSYFEPSSLFRKMKYRFQEATGTGTF